ncbi:zinc transporter ZntB, partial [Pseudomonas sp. FW305-130]
MSGFAYCVADGKAARIDIGQAIAATGDLVWVHLTSNNE